MGGGSRIEYPGAFDGYRGLIVLVIAVLHVTLLVNWVPENDFLRSIRASGFFTVEFLFVITGFAFFFPVAMRGTLGSLSAYSARRIARIVPTYLIALVATIVFVARLGHPPLPLGDLETFVAHVFFVHHQFGVSGYGINSVVWILSVIALFYVVAPFLWRPYLRHPLVGLGIAVLIVVCWRELWEHVPHAGFVEFPLFAGDFAIGMTAAWAFTEVRRRDAREWVERNSIAITLAAVAALTAMLYVVGHQRAAGEIPRYGEATVFAIAVPAAFIVAMCATTFMPGWAQAPLTNRAARWTGDVSYGVYLFHFLILRLAMRAFHVAPDASFATVLWLTALVLPLSLGAGWLSYRYVEQPVRRWARSREARPARTAVSPARAGSR